MSNTIIVSVMGRKGGITKTTISKELAVGLARAGLKVILVDADSQGNATTGMKLKAKDSLMALVQGAEWSDLLEPVPSAYSGLEDAYFFCLPSADGQMLIEKDSDTVAAIYERISELRGQVDIVIVDTGPGITHIHHGLYYASDYILLPTTLELESVQGIKKTLQYLNQAVLTTPNTPVAQVMGIVMNRYDASQKVQNINVGYVRGAYSEQYHVFPVPVRALAAWVKASQAKISIAQLYATGTYQERQQAKSALSDFRPVIDRVLELAGVQTTDEGVA